MVSEKLKIYLCALYHLQTVMHTSDPFRWTSHAITIQVVIICVYTEMVFLAVFFPEVLNGENPIYVIVLIPLSIFLGDKLVGDKAVLVSFYNQNFEKIKKTYVKIVASVFFAIIFYFFCPWTFLYFILEQ